MDNPEIAEALARASRLYELRGEVAPRRIRALRDAAFALESFKRSASDIFHEEGRAGLERIPSVGREPAGLIEELLTTGRMDLEEELVTDLGPEALLQTVPGIGQALARRIRDDLNINTLDDLEFAARSGALTGLPKVGPAKVERILKGIERRRARVRAAAGGSEPAMDNREIAEVLFKVASLMEMREQSNPFRVQAYRRAAATIQAMDRPVEAVLREEGLAGLNKIGNVGPSIASRIEELIRTGRLSVIERLVEELGPVALFQTVPGIGPTLAKRIREELNISTLEELEAAARTGQLERVPGIGPSKEQQIVQGIERARARLRHKAEREAAPPVDELLNVDEEYRHKAEAGRLETIAPKKYNPTGEKWLPILHTERGPRRYTAVYSNTRAAHEAGKTRDWVVLYWTVGRQAEEEQTTVVTETQGDLQGKRVIRGREAECREFYAREREPA